MEKVAFITGAASGIGQAIAENFLRQNYRIALVDLQFDALKNNALLFDIDITNTDHVKAAVKETYNKFGRIDVLFNGAGIAQLGGSEMSPEDFERIVKVNLFGTFNCIHEIVPIMKKQTAGYIFNVASRQGKMGGANLAGYASSKFGVVGLSESILKELIGAGIKVTALCPSYTDTPMMDLLNFPREEMLSPEDIVKTVNYLLSLSAPACVKEVLIEIRKLIT